MKEWDEQKQRILAVIGDEDINPDDGMKLWYRHLAAHLALPCDVTGIEDFQWEEFYVLGPGDKTEYQRLRRKRPSYRDVFQLTGIDCDSDSEWCLVPDELKAHVSRKSDGRQFVLGLSELKATNHDSQNYQLLRDYAVWLINYR